MTTMKKKVKYLIIICSFVAGMSLLPWDSHAQTNELGVRFGGTSGLTLRHYTSNTRSIEGILGFYGNGFSVTALFERHHSAFDVQGLQWYYGPGVHVAYYQTGRPSSSFRDTGYRNNEALGFAVNGIVGLEYRLPDNVPIAFSIDLKPFLEIDTNGDAAVAIDPGLGIRVYLNQN